MSNFGQIPSSGNVAPKNTGRSSKAEIVKIIRLPESLQNNPKATRIEGTVTQSNNNGSVRIQTKRGAIDVQFPQNSNDKAPREGQHLEVTIPAGKTPRQANIQRAPSENAPQTAQTRELPQTPQNPTQGQSRPIPKAPLPPQNLPQASQAQGQAPSSNAHPQQPPLPAAPLLEGANVRLVALPPNQAIQIAQQSLSTLIVQNSIITNAAFTANLIAQNAISQIRQSALNIASNLPAQTAQNITQNLLQPVTNNTAQQTVNTAFFQSVDTAQIIKPNTSSNILGSITTFQSNATLTPVKALNSTAIGKIDIQILKINQASINLTATTIGEKITPPPIPALTKFTPPIMDSNSATTITAQVTGITSQGQP